MWQTVPAGGFGLLGHQPSNFGKSSREVFFKSPSSLESCFFFWMWLHYINILDFLSQNGSFRLIIYDLVTWCYHMILTPFVKGQYLDFFWWIPMAPIPQFPWRSVRTTWPCQRSSINWRINLQSSSKRKTNERPFWRSRSTVFFGEQQPVYIQCWSST